MGRRTLLLITSILVAAVGTALIGLYVKGADTRATDKHALHTVLVATSMIQIGKKADNSNTEIQQWPQDTLPPAGYLPDGSTIANQTATTTIYPQTPLQKGMFSSTLTATTTGITPGQMGVTVELADPLRAAGLLKVGSKIEIFFVPSTPSSGGKRNAVPLLGEKGSGGITVIELGNDRVGGSSATSSDQGSATTAEDVPSTLVGLALTEEQVRTLRSAEANGALSFAVLPAQAS